jgi:SAM-dependent methyltransferase
MTRAGRISRAPLSLSAWLRYDAVRRLFPTGVVRVLEVGAGLGSFGALLAEEFEYVGLEPDPESHRVAAARVGEAGAVVNESVEVFYSLEPFDLVCAFEVLEHLENDSTALAGWLRHVRPGGYVLLSVPFARDRFGAWDRKAGHYRRYDRSDIVQTMESAGLHSIEALVYGFPLGRAMEALRNVVARFQPGDDSDSMEERTAMSGRQIQPPPAAAWATWAIASPFRLVQRPFENGNLGTGIVVRGQTAPA